MGKKNYEYLNMIGKGGFGKVWKVRHIPTGTIYALK
jgi:serine/threonine protein kinase